MSAVDTAAIASAVRRTVANIHPDPDLHGKLYDVVVLAAERQLLQSVLRFNRGNQSRSARHLGINRNTLRKLIRRHRIDY